MNLQKILRSISITALFLVPVFVLFPMPFWPFNFTDSFFFPFITGKAFYFRILVEVAFFSWVILAFLDQKYRPKFAPLNIGITLFVVIALIADLVGVNPVRSIWSNFERMEGWLVIVHLWGFYLAAVNVFGYGEEGKRVWHRWFNFSLVVACVVTVYAFVQLLGGAQIHQGSARLDASLGNAAYLAVYLLMHIGISMYMFFVARAKQIKNAKFLQWAYPVLAVVFSFIIIQTQTRGTIIGLVGGILLALALYAIFGKGQSKVSRWVSTGVIGLIIVLGVVFWLNRDTAFIKNTPSLDRIASISISDTKTQARAYVWPMAIKGFVERPILGWGQENFNYIFNSNYNPKMWNQEQWFDRAHSVFLDWLVASGSVGLLAYLALYVLALMAIWKSDLKIGKKSVLTGLIAGYAVHNVFVFDNLASYVFFFGILGFVGSLSRRSKNESQKATAKSAAKVFSLDFIEYVVLPIVIVAFAAGIYFLNIRTIQANTRLISALRSCQSNGAADSVLYSRALSMSPVANQEIREQILSCAGNVISGSYPSQTKQAFFDLATSAIDSQVATTPLDARIYVLGGAFMNRVGQLNQAEPLLIKAHELSPAKQSVTFLLATTYVNIGKESQAVELLKQAYESDPTYEEAKLAYISSLIYSGREAEARSLFKDDLKLFETGRAADAYVSPQQYP